MLPSKTCTASWWHLTFHNVWLLLFIQCHTEAARILLMPYVFKSHIIEVSAVGYALKERGHDLSMILPPSYPETTKMSKDSGFEIIQYKVKDPDFYSLNMHQMDSFFVELLEMSLVADFRENQKGFYELCSNPVSDENLFVELKSRNFDLAVVDSFPGSRCYLVLLYRLGIPYVSYTSQYEPWLLRAPVLPSFVPFIYSELYTERMTFWERLANLVTIVDWTAFTRVGYASDNFVREHLHDKPFRSLDQLAQQSLLWLMDTDLVLDYPRPTMANEVNIGGLSTKPAQPLPADLQAFMDSATHGVIIVSFGSADSIPRKYLEKFLAAFRMLKQRVVWRNRHLDLISAADVGGSIRMMEWIPQNDLLGHPNSKLFVTHCGLNSQFEALYHAVPMLGFPVFADQPYNARRITYRGLGTFLDVLSFTTDSLVQTINQVISNATITANMKKASAIFRSRPLTPRDRAAYWIEHVLEYGGSHLHSHALDMPWYEYLMLDILGFVMGIIGATSCLFVYICYVLRKRQKRDKVKEQ